MSGLSKWGWSLCCSLRKMVGAFASTKTKSRNVLFLLFESAFYTHINVELVFAHGTRIATHHQQHDSGSARLETNGGNRIVGCGLRGMGLGWKRSFFLLFFCNVLFLIFFSPDVLFFLFFFLSFCLTISCIKFVCLRSLPPRTESYPLFWKEREGEQKKMGRWKRGFLRTLWMAKNGEVL